MVRRLRGVSTHTPGGGPVKDEQDGLERRRVTGEYNREYFRSRCGDDARLRWIIEGGVSDASGSFTLDKLPHPDEINSVRQLGRGQQPGGGESIIVFGNNRRLAVTLNNPPPVAKNREGTVVPVVFDLDTPGEFSGHFDSMTRWDADGNIVYTGMLPIPLHEPEVRINVRAYRPLRVNEVAGGFRSAFDGYIIAEGLIPARRNPNESGRQKIMRSYSREIRERRAQMLGESVKQMTSSGARERRGVARAAGIVATLRLIEETATEYGGGVAGSEGMLGVANALNIEGVTARETARNLGRWAQRSWQRIDEQVRAQTRGDLLNAYDRLANDLFANFSNQIRDNTARTR